MSEVLGHMALPGTPIRQAKPGEAEYTLTDGNGRRYWCTATAANTFLGDAAGALELYQKKWKDQDGIVRDDA